MGGSDLRKQFIEGSSLAAAALYAYGWVITSLFYGAFDVAPEEVGIGFAYVTIRVFFVVAAAAIVVFVGWAGLRWLAARSWVRLHRDTVLWVLSGINFALFFPFVLAERAWVYAAVTYAVVALVAIVVWLRHRRPGFDHVDLGAAFRTASWGFVAIAVVLMVAVTPGELADELADDVRVGREVELRPMLGITLLQVDRVRAVTAGVEFPGCVGLLGTAGGTVVLYDAEARTVHRLPQEQVTLTSPCESSPISQ